MINDVIEIMVRIQGPTVGACRRISYDKALSIHAQLHDICIAQLFAVSSPGTGKQGSKQHEKQ